MNAVLIYFWQMREKPLTRQKNRDIMEWKRREECLLHSPQRVSRETATPKFTDVNDRITLASVGDHFTCIANRCISQRNMPARIKKIIMRTSLLFISLFAPFRP